MDMLLPGFKRRAALDLTLGDGSWWPDLDGRNAKPIVSNRCEAEDPLLGQFKTACIQSVSETY
ncbi:hypothetical protein [Ralstonia sp.]|uniref:hypothetical protein n=1 Tax=Ralstonia sp. TaxID=54061 RepID=UPI00257E2165|nr:hypothetical protein [Ralstonia sp.]